MLLLLPFVPARGESFIRLCVVVLFQWLWGIDFHSLARWFAIFGKLISVVPPSSTRLVRKWLKTVETERYIERERAMCAVDCEAKCILVSGHYHKSSPISGRRFNTGCSFSQSVGRSFRLPQSFAELDGKDQCGIICDYETKRFGEVLQRRLKHC